VRKGFLNSCWFMVEEMCFTAWGGVDSRMRRSGFKDAEKWIHGWGDMDSWLGRIISQKPAPSEMENLRIECLNINKWPR
jgi:hypothetical protein